MQKDVNVINALGPAGLTRAIDALRADKVKASAAATKVATGTSEAAPANPAATLAAAGAPIDAEKVATIKAALAAGTYKIDAKATAEAMIAQDLPQVSK